MLVVRSLSTMYVVRVLLTPDTFSRRPITTDAAPFLSAILQTSSPKPEVEV